MLLWIAEVPPNLPRSSISQPPNFLLIHTESASPMTCTYVLIALLSIEREAAACIKYLPLAVVLLCKARLLGGVGLLQPWLASRKLRAPLHTQRRASGPSARDPGPYTPDKSSYPCHLLTRFKLTAKLLLPVIYPASHPDSILQHQGICPTHCSPQLCHAVGTIFPLPGV